MAMGGQRSYDVLNHPSIGGDTYSGLNSWIVSIEADTLADLVILHPRNECIQKDFSLNHFFKKKKKKKKKNLRILNRGNHN
jgi:hypothetical protein